MTYRIFKWFGIGLLVGGTAFICLDCSCAGRNPYAYIQPEAFQWQFGFEQGRDRRAQFGLK